MTELRNRHRLWRDACSTGEEARAKELFAKMQTEIVACAEARRPVVLHA